MTDITLGQAIDFMREAGMTVIDFDDVVADSVPLPKDEQLKTLTKLVEKQISLEDWIADAETKLENAKAKLKEVSENNIPELMSQLNVREFRLSNGFKIDVKAWFNMKIDEEKAKDAYNWLNDHGHGHIVKHNLNVSTRMTNEKQLDEIKALAEKLQLDLSEKLGVHHMTGSAWVKDQLTNGKAIPRELLGVTQGFKTKIQRGF